MIRIQHEYTAEELRAFEARLGASVDFTLTLPWAKAAEESRFGRGVRALAFDNGEPVALAQGIARRRGTFSKLSCGSNSGFGVRWTEGGQEAAAAGVSDLVKRSRASIAEVFSQEPIRIPRIRWEDSFTIHIDLRKSIDVLLEEMKKEARKKIRRAERLGVTARVIEDEAGTDSAYDLIHATAESKKFPVPPKKYSLALHREFAKVCRQGSAVGFREGRLVSAATLLGYGKKVAWWKGGSISEGYETSAGNLVQLAAIEWAKRCGFEVYDLGGTNPHLQAYAGIHEFKTSLGGELVTTSLGTRSSKTVRLASRVARSLR